MTHSGPEVLFQDLRRDEIREWWWWLATLRLQLPLIIFHRNNHCSFFCFFSNPSML